MIVGLGNFQAGSQDELSEIDFGDARESVFMLSTLLLKLNQNSQLTVRPDPPPEGT